MDYAQGLYTSNLDPFIAKLDAKGMKYLAMRWSSDHGSTDVYYSVVFQICETQMVIELVSNR